MNRLTTLLLLILAAAVGGARAETKPPLDSKAAPKSEHAAAANEKENPQGPANEAADKKSVSAPAAIELKNKSAFQMEGDNRNPFWPIGWKPTENAATPTAAEHSGDIPMSAFLVSSITMDPRTRFAIINGKTMQEGQQFGLQIGTQTYQLTVKAIEDGRVVLSRRNQEIILTLRRK